MSRADQSGGRRDSSTVIGSKSGVSRGSDVNVLILCTNSRLLRSYVV